MNELDPTETGPRAAVAQTQPRLLSVEAAAEALGIGRTQVYYLIRGGHLASVKIGKRRLIPADALSTYIDALSTGDAAS